MGVDLRLEPYATMFEKERPESRIIDELCFPDITDKLIDRLGLSWNDFYALVYEEGRLPHEAALRLLAAVESHHALAESCLPCFTTTATGTRIPNVLPRKCRESLRAVRPAWRAESAISPTRVPG